MSVVVPSCDEPGFDASVPMPDVPEPDAAAERGRDQGAHRCRRCPSRCGAITSASGRSSCGRSSIDRYLGRKLPRTAAFNVWIRATGRLPDEPAIHQCVLAYASDMTLLDAALIPHGSTVFDDDIMAASLDHALWFHRPFRADEWLLYAQDSPNLSRRARLLARLDLHQRRHPGGLGGAGGPAAAAPAQGRLSISRLEHADAAESVDAGREETFCRTILSDADIVARRLNVNVEDPPTRSSP